jgi:hypothetical protein
VRPLAVGERRGTNRDGHRRASLFTWYVLGGRHGSVPRSEPGEAASASHRGGAPTVIVVDRCGSVADPAAVSVADPLRFRFQHGSWAGFGSNPEAAADATTDCGYDDRMRLR